MVEDPRFRRYVRSLTSHGHLDAETERRLARRWRATQNAAAARVLVESHLLFVVKVAYSFAGYGIPIAELVAEGNVGLVEALGHFDPARKVRFVSYAVWWIRARILTYVRQHGSVVRPPARLKPAFRERDVSLDGPLADGGAAPDDDASRVERERIVRWKLGLIEPTLSERERYIVRHRMLADEPETLRAIGRRFRVSRERARQIEERVKRKLREAFAELDPERRAA